MTTSYGLRQPAKPPLDWTDAHEHVLRCADRLWDDLRALWIQARQEQSWLEEETGDAELLAVRAAVSRAGVAVDEAFAVRRAWRQHERRGGSTPQIEQAINDALQQRREAWRAVKPVEKRIRSEIRDELRALWSARDADMRRVAQGNGRRYRDLHHGMYNDVHKRFCTAARKAAQVGRVPRPSAEHPSRSIYVQIPARNVGGEWIEEPGRTKRRNVGGTLVGIHWSQLLVRRKGVRLAPYRERADGPVYRLTLPVDAHGLEVTVPVYAEQVPPTGALLKGVRLVRVESAEERRPRWHVVWSVQAEHVRPIERGSGTLYCGSNWRRTPSGLRILDGIDAETGERIQVHVPPELVARVAWGDALQSALDRRAEETAALLGGDAPALVRRRNWEALRALAREDGREDLVVWAEGTAHRKGFHAALLAARRLHGEQIEKHAEAVAVVLGDRVGRWRLERHRKRTLDQRQEVYRQSARYLAECYGRIVWAQLDGRRLAQRVDPQTGADTELPLPARRARQLAAPSELVRLLRWACERAGIEWVEAPAIDASHTCPLCGEEMERSAGDRAALMLRCGTHGVWDRDHALSLALWRDDGEGDGWVWHAEREDRSQVAVVRVDEEVRRKLRGHGTPWTRLRYTSGTALANGRKT